MENLKETFSFILNHLEGFAGLFSFLLSCKIYFQMAEDKNKSSNEKRIEIYMDLSSQWDMIWANITSFPQKNKEIFKKDISEIDDENLRLAVSNAIHLLSRVYYYYNETNQNISESDWEKTCRYIFNKKLFFSMYMKHKNRYNKNFIKYIDSIVHSPKVEAKNIIPIELKKDLLISKNRRRRG